jgi:hypothetical protein
MRSGKPRIWRSRSCDVGRGEFLAVAQLARHPRDRKLLALLRREAAAALARRMVRLVVDLAAVDDRDVLVEE